MKAVDVSQLEFDSVANGGERLRETESANTVGVAMAVTCDAPREALSRTGTKAKARTATARSAEPELETLLTFAEAARVLGISLRQFRRLVDGGIIAFVRVSERSPRVRPSELHRFLGASAVKYEVKP